jgi:hypothetical protein
MRLGFAVAAHAKREILLIDEALAVGDTAYRMKCFQYFLERKHAGLTMILVSHNMIDIGRLCDRVVTMANGKIIHEGDVSAGIAHYEDAVAQRNYLREQRTANAAAWIERVSLLDSEGHSRDSFETGDDLFAEVQLAATTPVYNARLIVHVSSPSLGDIGAFASPYKGFKFDVLPPGITIQFYIREVPLLVGNYHLRLNLYGPEIKDFLHTLTNAASFKIVGPAVNTFGYGVCHTVRFEHDWQFTRSCRPAMYGSCDKHGPKIPSD